VPIVLLCYLLIWVILSFVHIKCEMIGHTHGVCGMGKKELCWDIVNCHDVHTRVCPVAHSATLTR
jgi:hypothetical protein